MIGTGAGGDRIDKKGGKALDCLDPQKSPKSSA